MIARHRSDRIFARALVLSLFLHLSAVTVFRIIFHFPHKDVDYFDVAIVPTSMLPIPVTASSPEPTPADHLSLSGPDFATAAQNPSALPAIELPALKFEGMEKLRIRQEALETRSRFDEFFAGDTGDAMATGETGLGALGQTLSRFTFGATKNDLDTPVPVSRPAPGFEAYIEWLSPPMDRKVLAVAPIDALWGFAPDALPEPITLAFRVDRTGKVERGVITLSGSSDIVKSAGNALVRYRFEPLLGDGPDMQSGTFIVRAGDTEP